MAADTRDDANSKTNSQDGAHPPRTGSRGIILGKDGKPCRTCNTLADFTSQTKRATKGLSPATIATDCPPDVEELGRSSWTLLHSISATYPERPTRAEQGQMKQFMDIFSKTYPCFVCAEDFQSYMEKNRVRTESRDSFGRWMCEAHNDVNKKLGKEEFDCNRWQERWKTGCADGSCD